uniref:Chromosome 1 open reading frame 87 n=1 Tax=Otolemur garnettii TaxID=30611 RepID=H0X5D5_OTOGA
MSAVWKTPRGSDAMPEITVKIIGSKHFRYLVEKPKIKEDENMKTEMQTVVQKPKTGNAGQMSRDPPAPTNLADEQTNCSPDDEEESKRPGNTQRPGSSQRLLTGAHGSRFLGGKIPIQAQGRCISVPTGDQSLSYVHGLPRRKLRDWSLEQMMSSGSAQTDDDFDQRPSGTMREDSFLLALVRRELKSHLLSPGVLDKLLKELKILDPISSGFLLQSQLSHLFLKHQVPLQLPTVKILCQRFSRRGSPEMVNYGKLLLFLRGAASDNLQQSKTTADSNLGHPEHLSDHRQSAPPHDSSSRSEANKSLLELLKMALKTANGKLNTENLGLSFRKEDHSFSGCLPPPKVRAICGKHGLYLSLSLLETLLNHQDLGYQNEIKWQSFVEMLRRASSDLLADLPTGKNEKDAPATPVQPKDPETSQSKTEHMKTPEEELQAETPAAETSAPKDPLSSLQIRPVSQPFMSPAMRNKSEESEMWMDRFRKLENALYLCDLSNSGVLERERARRLIHNYNHIYNLSLSPRKIDQALRRFRSGEDMLLEPALRYLKEL